MKKRNLIFLLGFKNTGKDTVAGMINKMSYGNYDIVGFADALKKDYYGSIGIEYNRDTEDRAFKESHRDGIIQYGEGMKQKNGVNHWIEKALDPLIFDKDSTKGIIVPDCRRVEELLWFKDFKENRLDKYSSVREKFEVHFLAVHRMDADKEDSDYLTHNTVRIATEEMYLVNRLVTNYTDKNGLKKRVEELYANRFK